MICSALLSAVLLFVGSIAALNIANVPAGERWAPGSTHSIVLEGNNIMEGDNVRVELWDYANGADAEAAVLAEAAMVNSQNAVSVQVPFNFPKTKNAFLRVYFKGHNAVSPRIAIKPEESLTTKQPHFTPSCIYTPTPEPTITHMFTSMPTPSVIMSMSMIESASASASLSIGHVIFSPSSFTYETIYHPSSSVVPVSSASVSSNSTTTTTAAVSTSSVSTLTAVTSTSSASMAKFSLSTVVVALAVALSAMLF